jgi:hypothetical protein
MLYIIGLCLILIIILLLIVLFNLKKNSKKTKLEPIYNKDDFDLILFLIHMYLEYGQTLDIFPTDDSKDILIKKVNELKILTEKNKGTD